MSRVLKEPSIMSASEINRELDKLDARDSTNTEAFIAADRGHERPSEYLSKGDPLSLEARAIYDRRSALQHEVERRYGPGAPRRLPPGRGFGPIKINFAAASADEEVTRQALRQDGPLIDVTLHARCGDRDCEPVRGKALIDTGADSTAVEWSEIDAVGAQPTGVFHAQGVTRESVPLPVYPMRVELGDGLGSVEVERAAATPHLKSQGLVALLGRDVLEKSNLHYDGPSGTYTLSTPGGTTRVESKPTSRAPFIAAGVALALGAAAAWLLAPACACEVPR